MSHATRATNEEIMRDVISRSQPCIVMRAQGIMISRATLVSQGVYHTAKHGRNEVTPLGELREQEKFVVLIGKHVLHAQVSRVPDATEPTTGFVDGVVVLALDSQTQAEPRLRSQVQPRREFCVKVQSQVHMIRILRWSSSHTPSRRTVSQEIAEERTQCN